MPTPQVGDLLIQRLPGLPVEFLIVDAVTHHVLSGPYRSFDTAVSAASVHASKIGVSVWRSTQGSLEEPQPVDMQTS